MKKEEIEKLSDEVLVKKVFEEMGIKNLKDFEERIGIPYNTSCKWSCKNGIPTKFPSRGGYRELFVSLLNQALMKKELESYREFFKLQKKLEESIEGLTLRISQ